MVRYMDMASYLFISQGMLELCTGIGFAIGFSFGGVLYEVAIIVAVCS